MRKTTFQYGNSETKWGFYIKNVIKKISKKDEKYRFFSGITLFFQKVRFSTEIWGQKRGFLRFGTGIWGQLLQK